MSSSYLNRPTRSLEHVVREREAALKSAKKILAAQRRSHGRGFWKFAPWQLSVMALAVLLAMASVVLTESVTNKVSVITAQDVERLSTIAPAAGSQN